MLTSGWTFADFGASELGGGIGMMNIVAISYSKGDGGSRTENVPGMPPGA